MFERANAALETSEKEERVMLLEAWKDTEKNHGDSKVGWREWFCFV